MRVIPKPSLRVKAYQRSICVIIHLRNSPIASVSWLRAGRGRERTAPALEQENDSCFQSGLEKMSGGEIEMKSVGVTYPVANTPPADPPLTSAERKLLGLSMPVSICCEILTLRGSWWSGTPNL
jgi:hypothetical protein